jgi:hypothetical protein
VHLVLVSEAYTSRDAQVLIIDQRHSPRRRLKSCTLTSALIHFVCFAWARKWWPATSLTLYRVRQQLHYVMHLKHRLLHKARLLFIQPPLISQFLPIVARSPRSPNLCACNHARTRTSQNIKPLSEDYRAYMQQATATPVQASQVKWSQTNQVQPLTFSVGAGIITVSPHAPCNGRSSRAHLIPVRGFGRCRTTHAPGIRVWEHERRTARITHRPLPRKWLIAGFLFTRL